MNYVKRKYVNELKKDQPLVSHHLKTLKKCGIVKSICFNCINSCMSKVHLLSELITKLQNFSTQDAYNSSSPVVKIFQYAIRQHH